ncbi:hypothetical protein [Glutamicibacter nicotianae]|uniref:hypothetical protein n=1 Tax=Glutamicibacter nicotianae TaxID=37929 RepID=UPI00167F211A|nr:hypothetical protein [Glutamicibacter nicotianae]
MPKTVHGIDLTAPGGIEALLAFHYQTFGDAVMQADGEEDEDNDSDEDEDGEDQDNSGSEDESDEDEEEVDGTDALGDKGQKALRAMKDRVKGQEAETKPRPSWNGSRTPRARPRSSWPNSSRGTARSGDPNKANERIVRSEIKSAAAGKLQNPALAIRLLDLADFEVDEDGNVDEDEIAQAIDELLEREPYLAVQSGSGPKFDSARGKRKVAKKYTRDDLKNMSSEEIAKAYDEGKVKL